MAKVDAVQVAAGHRQVARLLGAAGQQHGVELGLQLLGADGLLASLVTLLFWAGADQHAGAEGDALGLHLRHAAVDEATCPS
jgi:hypothetical protein